jgi:hypothetical protein
MGGGLPPAELAKVRQFVADTLKNGSSEKKAQPVADTRRRRTTPTNPRAARRERSADRWLEWFQRAMRESGTEDPAALLPDMAAKIEELIATKIAEEVAPLRRRIAELERAKAGATITAWKLNRERYEAIPLMPNGSFGAPLNVRELFAQFWAETGGGGS